MTITFKPVRVTRETGETRLSLTLRPGQAEPAQLDLPNRMLSHLLDHLCKGAGVKIELGKADWIGSFQFDHVLCEDLGQLMGRAVAAIHDQRAASTGVVGRASIRSCMDDAESVASISFEGRPSANWKIPLDINIDGWIDSWCEAGAFAPYCAYGTNIRQFIDGFAFGSAATISIEVIRSENLHHLYETIFRNLGDAIGNALGTAIIVPGQTSGLAAIPKYTVEEVE